MMKSVEPTWSASSTDLVAALRVGDDDAVGVLGPEGVDVLRPEALVHRAMPLPQQEGGLLALRLGEAAQLAARIPDPHVVVGVAHRQAGVAAEVLVGEEQHLAAAPRSHADAHSSTALAFVDVHTAPPWRPTNAFSAADEFMYVIGTSRSMSMTRSSASQASSTESMSAMSAIEQPAFRSGRITFWWSAVSTSADSAMKCTPQKTMNSASGCCWASTDSRNESPRASAHRITSSRW